MRSAHSSFAEYFTEICFTDLSRSLTIFNEIKYFIVPFNEIRYFIVT